MWRLPLLLVLVLAAILASRFLRMRQPLPPVPSAPPTSAVGAAGKTVSLVIQFGNGREQAFDSIAWRAGMTVDDLLTAASHQPARLKYQTTGDGAMRFLTSIDEVANDPAGGRGWTYRVNSVPADRSFAIYELRPGDRVLWTFGQLE